MNQEIMEWKHLQLEDASAGPYANHLLVMLNGKQITGNRI